MDRVEIGHTSRGDVSVLEDASLLYKTELRPSLLFLDIHKVLPSHNLFLKSEFILKISSTCIDCIFGKQRMFIENDSTLIRMIRKQ